MSPVIGTTRAVYKQYARSRPSYYRKAVLANAARMKVTMRSHTPRRLLRDPKIRLVVFIIIPMILLKDPEAPGRRCCRFDVLGNHRVCGTNTPLSLIIIL